MERISPRSFRRRSCLLKKHPGVIRSRFISGCTPRINENYDKYRELFTVGRAVLVVGEVNNGEDKPKIFPQEIMPLEEAPRRYTKQVHFRLHTAHLTPQLL